MRNRKGSIRIRSKRHNYYKSPDGPVYSLCENHRQVKTDLFPVLAAPAKRALEDYGTDSFQQLSGCTEREILTFHGIGKSPIPKLKSALRGVGLSLKNEPDK